MRVKHNRAEMLNSNSLFQTPRQNERASALPARSRQDSMRAREREELEIEQNENKALARYSHVFKDVVKQASRDEEQQGDREERITPAGITSAEDRIHAAWEV